MLSIRESTYYFQSIDASIFLIWTKNYQFSIYFLITHNIYSMHCKWTMTNLFHEELISF